MLQQRGNGHDEEASEKTKKRQIRGDLSERQSTPAQQRRHERQSHRTERDEAVFNLAAREIARRKTAQADADGGRGLEITGFPGIGDSEDVFGVNDDEQLNQRGDGEKVSVAQRGEPEDAVLADPRHLSP